MPDWDEIGDRLWKALRELDAGPVQMEAEKSFQLALIGAPGSGKTALTCALAGSLLGVEVPSELEEYLPEYRLPLSVEDISDLDSATLLVLLLDATKGSYVEEVAAADYLSYLGKPILVCYTKMDILQAEMRLIRGQARWRGAEILPLSTSQADTVQELLVPAILEVLPEHALVLARYLPLFRSRVAGELVERTALVNATYASASGLAEGIPKLRIPLSAGDIEVLSTNQAMMAYRLGLAHRFPLDWQQDVSALSSAVEVGELWRQLARRLLGLIPVWGLESKVGVAYGGTVVTGEAIQAWCDSGQALSSQVLGEMYRETAAQARHLSRDLVARARGALPAPSARRAPGSRFKLSLPRPHVPSLPRRRRKPRCPACGKTNPSGAVFCAYCGSPLAEEGGRAVDQAVERQAQQDVKDEQGAE